MFDLTKKESNTYLILNLIKDHGPISRTHIREITELRPVTISDITRELLEKGLIKTKGYINGGRGRNQILLNVNSDYLCAIGISIEATYISLIIGTLDGKILKEVKIDTTSYSNIDQIINKTLEVIQSIMKEFDDKMILGIGAGDPGIIDFKGEVSIFSSQFSLWNNVPLKSILEKSSSLPVKLEVNDRLKALGEKFYGSAKDTDDFIYIQLGQGIGASIVSNGSLVRGHNGTAGEFGHIHIADNNKICICGSYGCLETLASLNSILSNVRDAVKSGAFSLLRDLSTDINNINLNDVVKAANLNDKVCLNIIEHASIQIGIALSNVINMFNPKLIILGGVLCDLGDILINPIKSTVYKNSMYQATVDLEFKVSSLKESAAPLGAITMIFEDFFKTKYFKLTMGKLG